VGDDAATLSEQLGVLAAATPERGAPAHVHHSVRQRVLDATRRLGERGLNPEDVEVAVHSRGRCTPRRGGVLGTSHEAAERNARRTGSGPGVRGAWRTLVRSHGREVERDLGVVR
jgi:hypothetical protein